MLKKSIKNFINRIISIVLVITLAFNLNVYADDSGTGAEGDTHIGTGTNMNPLSVLGGGLRFYIFKADGTIIGGKGIDVFPKFMDTGGKDWTVCTKDPNNPPWKTKRYITPSSSWKYSKYCPVFYGGGDCLISEARTAIDGGKPGFISWYKQSFSSFAYDTSEKRCRNDFINLMKDIGVFSLGNGIPTDGDSMTTVTIKEKDESGVEVEKTQEITKFEAWLRGFDSAGKTQSDQRPFIICETTKFTQAKSTYGTDSAGTNGKRLENITSKDDTTFKYKELHFSDTTKALKLVTNQDLKKSESIYPDAGYMEILTMPKVTDSKEENADQMTKQKAMANKELEFHTYSIDTSQWCAGYVSGWSIGGGDSGGGGGGGDTKKDDDPKFPDTGKSQDMILYEDELAYFYSLTNINLGANRGLKVREVNHIQKR